MSDVQRYGFEDDEVTWGPMPHGAFVGAHDYDALLADRDRLAGELAQYREWHRNGRANVEYVDGVVRICKGYHDKHEPCEWAVYVAEAALSAARAALRCCAGLAHDLNGCAVGGSVDAIVEQLLVTIDEALAGRATDSASGEQT